MYLKSLFFLFFLLIYQYFTLKAQSINNYTTSRNTGIVYSSISSTGTSFGSWRNAGTFSQDDNRSNFTNIGFDFWYNGIRYTQFSVSTNGFIDFSASTLDGTGAGDYGYNNPAFTSNGSGTWNSLAIFYDDLTAQGGSGALGNSIKYQVSGTAPNRVLTIEWINMAVYGNTSPSLNYQIKLFETTGVIQYIYGTMTQGTAGFSYTCGINAATLNNTPTIDQAKILQVANSTTFNNTQTHNLTAIPVSNSRYNFTPPSPANPAGSLTFSGITQTSMTLNWSDWATNEVGYAIYYSTDGINYFFSTQTLANASNATVSGLLPGTTYFWKVFAVTEGTLSNSLNGTQATNPAGNKISIVSGSWNTAGTWSPNGVPTAADNVIINNGHTVTVNTNAVCNNLTIGQGTSGILSIGNNNTSRNITVNNNLIVSNGASFSVNTGSNTTHQLSVLGNFTCNGIVNMASDGNSLCDISFVKNGNQSISGSIAPIFNRLNVNLGNNILNSLTISTPSFTAATNFLNLSSGTFNINTTSIHSLIPFSTGAAVTINDFSGLTLNNVNLTVSLNDGLNLYGAINVSNGTLNIGNAANENIQSLGGTLTLNNGTINIAGRYYTTGINDISYFTITGGNVNVPTVSSTSTTDAPFQISGPGSVFNMTGGAINILREGGNGAQDFGYVNTGSSSGSVTGGCLVIGSPSTPVGQTMRINSSFPVGALVVNSANANAQLITNNLIVYDSITINSGTLNANNLSITLGGNWKNAGTFTPGTGTVTFNGSGSQTIRKTGGETFYNIIFGGSGTKTLNSAITVSNNLSINNGSILDVSASSHNVTLSGNFTNNGNFVARNGNVQFNGAVAKTIGGASLTEFYDLTINNTGGISITSAQTLRRTLTLSNGNFTTSGQTFTLLSDAAGTARIAAITGTGDITGNITMQRFLPNAPTDWRMIGSCVSGPTLSSWSDDFVMSGFTGSQAPSFPFISVYSYDETIPGNKDLFGYVAATNITNTITSGKGYYCYIGPTPINLDITGPPFKFAQSLPVTYTNTGSSVDDGWNLISNKYPSSIDWDAAAWTKTNISNEIHIWNVNTQSYASYSGGVGVNGGSAIIPSSQAFWVKATSASPVLSMNENVKSAIDQNIIKSTSGNYTDLIKLTMYDTVFSDELAIRFIHGAQTTYESDKDAYKLYSANAAAINFASVLSTGEEMAINQLPPLTSSLSIPIMAKTGTSGNFVIKRDTGFSLSKATCVVLEDLYTGVFTDFNTNNSYSFYLWDTTTRARFVLHFGEPLNKITKEAICPSSTDGYAVVKGTGAGPWDYVWSDLNLNTIQATIGSYDADTLRNQLPGTYSVTVSGNGGNCSILSDTLLIGAPQTIQTIFNVTNPTCENTFDGSIALNQTIGGTSPYLYYSATGNNVPLDSLSGGDYVIVTSDSKSCLHTDTIHLSAMYPVTANFSTSSDTLYFPSNSIVTSNYSQGGLIYNWDFGNNQVSSDENPIVNYATPGSYWIQLIASNGFCSDTTKEWIVLLDTSSVIGISDQIESQAVSLIQVNANYYLKSSYLSNTLVLCSLYSLNGQLIKQNWINLQKGINPVTLPETQGVYLLELRNEKIKEVFRVIKMD